MTRLQILMMRMIKHAYSKIELGVIITVYIFLLNLISNHGIHQIFSSVWLALTFLVIVLLCSFLSKLLFKGFLALQIVITSFAIFVKSQYGITISTDIMLSALLNETDLTLEMVSLPLLAWLVFTAVLPCVWLWFSLVKQQSFKAQFVKVLIMSGICLTIILSYFTLQGYQFKKQGNIRDTRFVTDLSHFSPLDVIYNFNRARRAYHKLKIQEKNIKNLSSQYAFQSTMDDVLVVFVIGETTRGNHFGLNGYQPDTTPKLRKIKNLYSFTDATSCDTLTINSVYCFSSRLIKSDNARLPNESSFGEILHHLGFHTEIYSLQTLSEFYKYLNYDKLVGKYQILNEQQQGAKDVALIPYAKKAIDEYHDGKKLIILHTLGSHQTYADRFGQSYEAFTPYCKNPDVTECSHDALVHAFDNSVLAVDDFLATIITELKDKKAILVYVSDHGESLGENGNYFHGKPIDIAPKEQFSIPFVVWFSDAYLADGRGKQLAQALKKHWQLNQNPSVKERLTVSHDNVFHSLLGCAGVVSSQVINSTLNLCQ